ncbi:MAG TPA: cupredoxin domain-containing protein [Opitutales bacterium]|jgi:plastocyanin domain-containing protein|nr:cupredoxin domain-containing protein [Opitutales bacterium]
MKKTNLLWLAVAIAIAGAILFLREKPGGPTAAAATAVVQTPPVSLEGKQVFEITVKEGYTPNAIIAKAGIPVVLKMKTQGTFDCSSTFTVPKLGIRTTLPSTGEALIDIPAQKSGDSVNGVCGMGMFTLVIKFT